MRVSNTDGSDSNLTTLLSQEKFPRTMSEIAFTYQPLSAEADTRIIELQPAPDALYPLQCRIAELCLSSEDLVDYEALSYTWGQPDFSECLFVLQDNGQRSVLKITLNLKEALQRLRLRDRDRRIWVDAVCIDQQDDTDKTHQIPSMTQIYKSAGRVLVWLGWSPEGQRALVDIKKAMRFHSRDDEKIRSHISNLSRSFENLVNLPWFSRRWVIQEVVLAADVVVICGLEEFPFVQLLRMVINLLRDAKTLDHTTQTALGPLAAISKLWGAWVFDSDGVKGLRLYDLLQVFANLDCAEDHDKVFALCGLASDCIISDKELYETPTNKVSIVIDYNQPAGILCQSITEQILGLKPERDNGFEWMNIMQKPVSRRSSTPPSNDAMVTIRPIVPFGLLIGVCSREERHYIVLSGEKMDVIVFSKCVADSTLAYPAIQKLLRCYFGESEVDNLPSDVDEMCMHLDSAWWDQAQKTLEDQSITIKTCMI
ncbi:hypothetical protein G7054_g12559 [Neopestalotiopsis clavispora]|nr:hypothetical protein G7054_g12559 [Neopestalotiopsis clavispora]